MMTMYDWHDDCTAEQDEDAFQLWLQHDGSFEAWAAQEGIDLTATIDICGEACLEVDEWAHEHLFEADDD